MEKPLNERSAHQPSLYRLAADGVSLEFEFALCGKCQSLNFPANAPGCRHCGAPLDGGERIRHAGGGALLEFVTLHVALRPGMATPSIVGNICIADGIIEEGVLGVSDEKHLSHGMALRAVAVPLAGGEHYTCQFIPAEEFSA